MVTKTQTAARSELFAELKKLQDQMHETWIEGSLPEVWNEIPVMHPVKPDKTKVTLTLDADMVRWFRKLGRGYQARINSILRVYWQALLSGQIKAHWSPEQLAPLEERKLELKMAQKIRDLQKRDMIGVSKEELDQMKFDLSEGLRTIEKLHQRKGD